MNPWWSWALSAIGLVGWWLTGRRSPWGWAVGVAVQVLWLAYALVTEQWGFILSALLYGAMAAHNLRKWRAEARLTKGDADGHHLAARP